LPISDYSPSPSLRWASLGRSSSSQYFCRRSRDCPRSVQVSHSSRWLSQCSFSPQSLVFWLLALDLSGLSQLGWFWRLLRSLVCLRSSASLTPSTTFILFLSSMALALGWRSARLQARS